MKILELCLSPDLGGLELYMCRAAKALSATDEVIALVLPTGQLVTCLQDSAIRVVGEQVSLRAAPLAAARRVARLIDDEGIDAVHVHWGKDLPLAAFAKFFSRRKPRLVYTRQMQITRRKDDGYHNFLYRQVDVLLTITQRLAEATRGFLRPEFAAKVHPLYYGVAAPQGELEADERVALRQEWGVPENVFLVGLIARIEHFKGQHLLLEAVARIPGLHALVVGHAMDETYLEELKTRASEADLAGRIHFLGFTNQPQRCMQACDTIVLTTYEETFGLVLAEAMRAGVAVIGSNSGGVPEIIDDGQTGLLFEPGDSESLASGLRRLYETPDLRSQLAAAGKAKADHIFDNDLHFAALRATLAGSKLAVGNQAPSTETGR